MKILIVDDSKTIRRIIKGVADVLGRDSLEACNGIEATELLAEHYKDIGLIILDVHMPEMGGFEVLKTAKSDERYKGIPVMMVTTEAEKGAIRHAISAGAKHYITKPFTAEDLTARITECLGMGMDLDLET